MSLCWFLYLSVCLHPLVSSFGIIVAVVIVHVIAIFIVIAVDLLSVVFTLMLADLSLQDVFDQHGELHGYVEATAAQEGHCVNAAFWCGWCGPAQFGFYCLGQSLARLSCVWICFCLGQNRACLSSM